MQIARTAAGAVEAGREGDDFEGAKPAPGRTTLVGRPLDADIRTEMERLFGGADFSAVRIHEGDHATDAGAAAYTQGTDIHFGPGHYAPQSAAGKRLLGHELAHVVQQARTTLGGTRGLNADASLESHADQVGDRVARGEMAGVSAGAIGARQGGPIQRMRLAKSHDLWGEVEEGGTVDTATCPLSELHAVALEAKRPLQDRIWVDFDRRMLEYIGANRQVQVLDTKYDSVVGHGSVKGEWRSSAPVVQTTVGKKAPPQKQVKNFIVLAYDAEGEGTDKSIPVSDIRRLLPWGGAPPTKEEAPEEDVNLSLFSGETLRLLELFKARADKAGPAIQSVKPSGRLVDACLLLAKIHGGSVSTSDRTVFETIGTFEAGYSAFATVFGEKPELPPEQTTSTTIDSPTATKSDPSDNVLSEFGELDFGGPSEESSAPKLVEDLGHEHAREGTRRIQRPFEGTTLVLREESSATNNIRATIEIQFGRDHSVEYKWGGDPVQRRHERERVDRWRPEAPISKVREQRAATLLAHGSTGPIGKARSGGSTGALEAPAFDSFAAFETSKLAESFKPKALVHLAESKDDSAKLAFVNRCFAGSRFSTKTGMQDLPSLGSVSSVLKYHKENEGEKRGVREEVERIGGEVESSGATTLPTPAVSIEKRFWERFASLSDEGQIRMIDEALGSFGGGGARITVANNLPYVEDEKTPGEEPGSVLVLGEYRFDISSRHAFKFHEQSLGSHPGHGGTLKEVELAVAQAALARHLAGALPRMGAIGGISDSRYEVRVGGQRIVYTAWVGAPTAKLIHISDYMAIEEDRKLPSPELPTGEPGASIDELYERAARIDGMDIGGWTGFVVKEVLPMTGQFPHELVELFVERTKAHEKPATIMLETLREHAPAFVPDVFAAVVEHVTSPPLVDLYGQLALRLYGSAPAVPDDVVAALSLAAGRALDDRASMLLGELGFAKHPGLL